MYSLSELNLVGINFQGFDLGVDLYSRFAFSIILRKFIFADCEYGKISWVLIFAVGHFPKKIAEIYSHGLKQIHENSCSQKLILAKISPPKVPWKSIANFKPTSIRILETILSQYFPKTRAFF